MPRIGQHRNSRRIERGIEEYLSEKTAGKNNWRGFTSMLKKTAYDQSPAIDGWASFDPVDGGVMDRLFTKGIREREEKVMLAVLENAIEYFQKYVLATDETGTELFREAEEWIL